jgi:hypothetical protein
MVGQVLERFRRSRHADRPPALPHDSPADPADRIRADAPGDGRIGRITGTLGACASTSAGRCDSARSASTSPSAGSARGGCSSGGGAGTRGPGATPSTPRGPATCAPAGGATGEAPSSR